MKIFIDIILETKITGFHVFYKITYSMYIAVKLFILFYIKLKNIKLEFIKCVLLLNSNYFTGFTKKKF